MESINNIFLTAGDAVAKYRKTVDHSVSGWRLDPEKPGRIRTEFLLLNDTGKPDYDHDVIELYSKEELAYFRQANKYLIEGGLVEPYNGTRADTDERNLLTEDDVEAIAAIKQIPALRKRLEQLTSSVTVQRVYDAASLIGRPLSVMQLIQSRIDELRPSN